MSAFARPWVLCSVLAIISGSQTFAQQSENGDLSAAVATNLEVLQSLARDIGNEVGRELLRVDTGSVAVTVRPKDSAWYVESPLIQGLMAKGVRVVTKTPATFDAEIGFTDARVYYSEIRSDGFLGPKLVNRKVSLSLSTKIVDARSGSILQAGQMRREVVDTIALSSISKIENPNLPITQGEIPKEGFFTNLVEPLIVLGAVAVAVILLFNVRS